MSNEPIEYLDVLVVGAGISGIGAAVHLQQQCPGKTWAIPANGSGPNREITDQLGPVRGLTSFGEDRKGNVYLVTSTTVKRIRA
jgi:hypothetical protein